MGVKTHSGLTLVPWESWHLWNQVREAVFSSSQSRVSAALDKIAAWRARSSLPIAVEVTGDLIKIHRADPRFSGISTPESSVTDEMLRLMYATAIMRLVNGVVDRSKRQNSMSVAERAEAARFPRMLVDIRHEVAHKELPSLSYLQLASKQALEWLKVQYWEAQKQVLDDTYGDPNASLVGPTLMSDEMGRTDLLPTNARVGKLEELVCGNSVANVELNKNECALLEAKKRLRWLHRTDLLPANARPGKLEELVCGNSVDNTIDVEFKKIECALLEAKERLRSLHKSTHTMLSARSGPDCKVPIDTVDFSVANSFQKIEKGRAEEQSSLKEAWTITENWRPCAIGMLPSASHSTGVLPFYGNMFSGLSGETATCQATFQGDSSSEAEGRISMEEDAIAAVCGEIKNLDGKSKFVGKKRDLVENETKKGMGKRFKPDTEAMQTPEKGDDSCRIDRRVHSDVSNEEPGLVRSGLLLLENRRASLSGGFLLLDGSYQRCGVDQLAAIRCAIQVLK